MASPNTPLVVGANWANVLEAIRFTPKLPHYAHKLFKCDWRQSTCVHAPCRIRFPTSEVSPKGIHRNASVMSASPHSQKTFRIKLYMSSFGPLPSTRRGTSLYCQAAATCGAIAHSTQFSTQQHDRHVGKRDDQHDTFRLPLVGRAASIHALIKIFNKV